MSEHKIKQAQFTNPPKKRNRMVILGSAFGVIALILLGWNAVSGDSSQNRRTVVRASQGQILIPAAQVSDGLAHFYTYSSGTTDVNFFVVKSTDGQIRAAIDSCVQCYRSLMGYRQLGDFMICNKCNKQFHTSQINEVRGGCNPVPLTRTLVGSDLTIPEAELIQGAAYFRFNP